VKKESKILIQSDLQLLTLPVERGGGMCFYRIGQLRSTWFLVDHMCLLIADAIYWLC